MELSAIAETTVEMWVLIDAKLIARNQSNIDPVIKSTLLREAMSLYMTNIINTSKFRDKPAEKQTEGNPASTKQLSYIKDLGGDPTTVHTSVEASKYIEDLRKN